MVQLLIGIDWIVREREREERRYSIICRHLAEYLEAATIYLPACDVQLNAVIFMQMLCAD